MTIKELIRQAMREKKVRQEDLAEEIGYASHSGVSRILTRDGGMTVSVASKMLSGLGYELQVVDKETGEILGVIDDNSIVL